MSSAAKTAYVETGITLATPVFSALSQDHITAPLSVTLSQVGHSTTEGVYRGVLISWAKPSYGTPVNYTLMWRKDSGNYITVENLTGYTYEIPSVLAGTYEVLVYANSITGARSPAGTGSIVVDLSSGTGSALNPVTGFTVVGGGTAFTGQDLNVVWTNPATNNNITAILKDFKVEVYDGSSNLLRTDYVGAGTAPGSTATYAYTFTKNVADGGPRRSVRIVVSARDTNNKTSTGNSVTFTNAAPAVLSNVVVAGGLGSVKISYNLPTDSDFSGVLIWADTTTGFTPSSTNLVYDGSANYVALTSLTPNQTMYFRLAAYDTFFARDYSGTGLTLTGEFSAAASTISATGIPAYATAPVTGVDGDFYYNTTDKHLYQWVGTTGWVQVANDISANTITGAMIAANTISASNIAAATITGDRLVANTITADKIAAGTITANEIAASTITAGKLSVAALDINGNLNAATGSFGAVTVATGGNIKMGQTAFLTGSGFFLGDDAGTTKFSIGNPAGSYLSWDGVNLSINGSLTDSTAYTATGAVYTNNTMVQGSVNQYSPWTCESWTSTVTNNASVSVQLRNISLTENAIVDFLVNGSVVYTTGSISFTLNTWYTFNPTIALVAGNSLQVRISVPGNTRYYQAQNFSVSVASANNIATSNANTFSTTAASYTMAKQIQMPRGGTVTVTFDIWAAAGTAYGRIYKNGTAVGTIRSTTSTTPTAFFENITFVSGDKLELWVYNSSSSTTYTKRFEIAANQAMAVPVVLL